MESSLQKSFFIILLLLQPVFSSDENPIIIEANQLLDQQISYYLLDAHDLHVDQVKVLREKGIQLHQLKKADSENEKLEFLLTEKQKILEALKKVEDSEFKKIQLMLVAESVQMIEKSLESEG